MKEKKMKIIGVISIFLILIVIIIANIKNNMEVVCYVYGEPIYLEEFQIFYDDNKIEIYNDLSKEGVYKNEDSFWNTPLDGETPLEMAKKMTIEEVSRNKVIQIISKENNVIDDIDYKQMKKDLKKENRRRENAIRNNEVVYGRKQYTDRQYYIYLFDTMVANLKRKFEVEDLDLSSDILKKYYEDNKEALYKISDKIVLDVISMSYLDNEKSVKDENKEKVYGDLNSIREKILLDKDINDVSSINRYTEVFDYENRRENEKNKIELIDVAKTLNVGDISEPVDYNGSYNLIICKEKSSQGYKRLEDVEDQIKVILVDEYYKNIINDRLTEDYMKINTKVYKNIR